MITMKSLYQILELIFPYHTQKLPYCAFSDQKKLFLTWWLHDYYLAKDLSSYFNKDFNSSIYIMDFWFIICYIFV